MQEKKFTKKIQTQFKQNIRLFNRRFPDRRREPCKGFTYITTVGWICRREKNRRKDDSCGYNEFDHIVS